MNKLIIEKIKNGKLKYELLSSEWKDSEIFTIQFIESDYNNIRIVDDKWKSNPIVIETLLEKPNINLSQMMIVIKNSNDAIKNNKNFLKKYIEKFPSIIEVVGEKVKADETIGKFVVQKKGSLLMHLAQELRSNRDLVLIAVENEGYALKYASKELKDDKEIVFKAIKKDGNSFAYASEEIRKNKEVIDQALSTNGWNALYHIPETAIKEKGLEEINTLLVKLKESKSFDELDNYKGENFEQTKKLMQNNLKHLFKNPDLLKLYDDNNDLKLHINSQDPRVLLNEMISKIQIKNNDINISKNILR